ncbi:MAG TPA: hydrogenase 3 membrane subunit, partial [Enterobacteriaceae bacterium]|nr:hydrogenase 3 membrane subunit [Enterobacteriaceae bacterium]
GISLKQLVVLQLFLGLFCPFGQAAMLSLVGLPGATLLSLVKLAVAVFVIALLENSVARLRFLKTSRTTWAGFGLACLALVSWLAAA